MKKLIFDFDGTLVDSMQGWADFIFDHLDNLHISYPDDIIKIVSPLGTRGAANYLIDLGVDSTVDDLLELMDSFALDEYTYRVPAKAHVIEKLKELKNAGYSLNILTACNHNLLDPCLKRLGIYDAFDNIWSCEEDLSMSKKEVELYTLVSKKLDSVCENCVFFDDNIGALTTAKESGMITVGVFDTTSDDLIDEIKSITDKYIYDFSELNTEI
ncbi:MAG: HAD-IA family hydrolase [Clostridia bacterium]|nr:HAD-IA family hydrolase [Clostridia bacterium]